MPTIKDILAQQAAEQETANHKIHIAEAKRLRMQLLALLSNVQGSVISIRHNKDGTGDKWYPLEDRFAKYIQAAIHTNSGVQLGEERIDAVLVQELSHFGWGKSPAELLTIVQEARQ